MSLHVRNLRLNENWPEELFMGFEGPQLQREWCWVVEHNGTVCGGIIGIPAHGMLMLLRVSMRPQAPLVALRALLQKVFYDARLRGLQGYITLLDPTKREGGALLGLVRSVNGFQWPEPIVLVWGMMRDIFQQNTKAA